MKTLYKYLAGDREVTFLDEDNAYEPEDVQQHWAQTFPELSNASTSIDTSKKTVVYKGAEVEVERVVTFAKRVGVKGLDDALAVDLLLFRVEGKVEVCGFGPAEVRRTARALHGDMAVDEVLADVQRERGQEAVWVGKPDVAIVPEDEMMRQLGAPMLPGFEALFDGG